MEGPQKSSIAQELLAKIEQTCIKLPKPPVVLSGSLLSIFSTGSETSLPTHHAPPGTHRSAPRALQGVEVPSKRRGMERNPSETE